MQMLAISNHFASLVYLQNENVVLKSSIEDCTRTIQLVHSEMNGLKTLRNREKKLLEEQRKYKDVIKGMEGKLENANNLIRSLQGGGMLFNGNAHPHTTDKLKTTPLVRNSSITSPLQEAPPTIVYSQQSCQPRRSSVTRLKKFVPGFWRIQRLY
jgi:hypothetical protein